MPKVTAGGETETSTNEEGGLGMKLALPPPPQLAQNDTKINK
jgi:hypothetical protein